ncbi:hypothetical protein JFL47_01975 [Haemophilus haemoglobinophilus]|nr:hypothetical protein [Canicola haemoglobinophilus]
MANEKDKIDAQEIKKELEGIDLKKIDEPIILENIIGIIDSLSNSGEVSNKLLAIRLQNDLKQNPAYIALLEGEESKENDRKKKEDNMFGLKTHNTTNREEVAEREHKREKENREANLRSARQHGLIMSNIGASFVFVEIQEEIFSDFLNEMEMAKTFEEKMSYSKNFLQENIGGGNFLRVNKNGVFASMIKTAPDILNKGIDGIEVLNMGLANIEAVNKKIAMLYNQGKLDTLSFVANVSSNLQAKLTIMEGQTQDIKDKEEAAYWHHKRTGIPIEESKSFINNLDEKGYLNYLEVLNEYKSDVAVNNAEVETHNAKSLVKGKDSEEKVQKAASEQILETNYLTKKTTELLNYFEKQERMGMNLSYEQKENAFHNIFIERGGYETIANFNNEQFEVFLKDIPEEYRENFRKFQEYAKKSLKISEKTLQKAVEYAKTLNNEELEKYLEKASPKQKVIILAEIEKDSQENTHKPLEVKDEKEIENSHQEIKNNKTETKQTNMEKYNKSTPEEKAVIVQENVEKENKKIEEKQQKLDETINIEKNQKQSIKQ